MSQTKFSADSSIQRNEKILASKIDKEVVIFDENNNSYFSLNRIGTSIWELLDQPKSIKQLISELQAVYEVSAEQCESDVLPFLDTLINKELLVVVP